MLDEFTTAYIEAALWSSIGDDEEPLDKNHSCEDFTPEAKAQIVKECKKFYEANEIVWYDQTIFVSKYPEDEQAGHDFWLTRNGHGAGFLDGDWSEHAATKLTEAAKAFGPSDLLVGDDGGLYVYPVETPDEGDHESHL